MCSIVLRRRRRKLQFLAATTALAIGENVSVLGVPSNSDVLTRCESLQSDTAVLTSPTDIDLPSDVAATLSAHSDSTWSELDDVTKVGLLWVHGYVFSGGSSNGNKAGDAVVQVYTRCSDGAASGMAMADVEVSYEEFTGNQCEAASCGSYFQATNTKCVANVTSAMHCAISGSSMTLPTAEDVSFWSSASSQSTIPYPQVYQHSLMVSDTTARLQVYSIHMRNEDTGVSCGSTLDTIIPCMRLEDSGVSGFCKPTVDTATVKNFLASMSTVQVNQLSDDDEGAEGDNMVVILGAAIGGGVLLIIVIMTNRGRRSSWYTFGNASNRESAVGRRSSMAGTWVGAAAGGKTVSEYCNESEILTDFMQDPEVFTKRIAFDELTFLRMLSKGAYGEVWLGQLETRHVAIKRLLPEKCQFTASLEQFAGEIQLMCTLQHQYMEAGDLDDVLKKNREKFSWQREKISIAMDIAEGLVYLHCLRPVVVHRDLKSKNVLLNRKFHAKLSDFGVSRKTHVNETMTSGVGTLLWTAPEIIEGKKYSEKADIYSLGVVLSEMDTCEAPFADVTSDKGERLPGMQIAQLVRLGKIRVSLRKDCPPNLHKLVMDYPTTMNKLQMILKANRDCRRRIQMRYQDKKKKAFTDLKASIPQLRDHVKQLQRKFDDLSRKKETLWSVSVEYFRIFEDGLTGPSKNVLDFLQAAIALDVDTGAVFGLNGLVENWRNLTQLFPDIHTQLDGLAKVSTDTVIAKTTTTFTITKKSLQNVFPHLVNDSKIQSERRELIIAKLLGRRILMRGSVRFDWDNTDNHVVGLYTQNDMLTPMFQLLGNMEDISLVFSGALISPDGCFNNNRT
ncbi:Protein kinase [Phytophthora palmivora]|uniref:Protein kinase n=1 Tax=Phytophthora palmivora TaxID=4796 RepID=A0A2P4Y0A5_9STRA|nr:Protein kinase [Phytophthora palmivora]